MYAIRSYYDKVLKAGSTSEPDTKVPKSPNQVMLSDATGNLPLRVIEMLPSAAPKQDISELVAGTLSNDTLTGC